MNNAIKYKRFMLIILYFIGKFQLNLFLKHHRIGLIIGKYNRKKEITIKEVNFADVNFDVFSQVLNNKTVLV